MPKSIAQGDLSRASNEEELKSLVSLLRSYCADEYRKHYLLTTAATGAFATIWSADMPSTSVWRVSVDITARATNNLGRATYTRVGLFFRAGGATIQVGATTSLVTIENPVTFDVSLSASGNGVRAQVQDDGVLTVNWIALVRIEEI